MVKIGSQRLDLEVMALIDLMTKADQFGFHFGPQQSASVLDDENEVIVQVIYTVVRVLQSRPWSEVGSVHADIIAAGRAYGQCP